MFRKTATLALSALFALSLAACGGAPQADGAVFGETGAPETAESTNVAETPEASAETETSETLPIEETIEEPVETKIIQITGVYAGLLEGDFYSMDTAAKKDGYIDLFIVFDFVNDDLNRTMPESNDSVTLMIGRNSYNAADNEQVMHQKGSTKFTEMTYEGVQRATGYGYAIGYGDVLGGAEPIRMFLHFVINPNDLTANDVITLSIDDLSAEFPVSEIQEIAVGDEILRAEGDFETAQILAAERWRIDSSAQIIVFLLDTLGRTPSGSDYNGMSQAMGSIFSDASGGVSIFESHRSGFSQKTHLYNTEVPGLPSYNRDVIVSGYSEVADLIVQYEDGFNELADMITTPDVSKTEFDEKMNDLLDLYYAICDAWGLEPIENH